MRINNFFKDNIEHERMKEIISEAINSNIHSIWGWYIQENGKAKIFHWITPQNDYKFNIKILWFYLKITLKVYLKKVWLKKS